MVMNRELNELRAMRNRLQTAFEKENDPNIKRKLREIGVGSTYGRTTRYGTMGNSRLAFNNATRELIDCGYLVVEPDEEYSENTRCSRASSRETSDEC